MNLQNSGFDKNSTYFEHSLDTSGIPTVFIHGVGLDHTMWLPQKKYFHDKNVIFYDLLNHGRSKKDYKELKFNKETIKVISFDNLTTKLCKKYKAKLIIRGLRAVSDIEYEFQLAGMNKILNKNIETIFLMSEIQHQVISSRLVKEIVELGGDVAKFTTKNTIKMLNKKIKW